MQELLAETSGPHPIEIIDASELLLEPVPAPALVKPKPALTPLVPADVLEELHARGEIDLFDEDGNLVMLPEELSPDEIECVVDDDEFEELIEVAPVERVVDPEEVIDALARVPLFSELDHAALSGLADGATIQIVGDRSYVFREGELAETFFLVAEGAFEALRRTRKGEVAMHQFRSGEVFGIFGLLAGQKRAASVRAIGQAEVIAITAEALSHVMERFPVARRAIERFFTERLLENFLASSPIFEDLSAVARGLLISQFREKKLNPNDRVVSPGEVFNGLFLVLSGRLTISKRQSAAREEELALLDRGEFFGIVSALSGTPCRCTITAEKPTTVAMLPQKAFNEFIKDYPILRQLPSRLAEQGLLVERDIFIGGTGIPGLS